MVVVLALGVPCFYGGLFVGILSRRVQLAEAALAGFLVLIACATIGAVTDHQLFGDITLSTCSMRCRLIERRADVNFLRSKLSLGPMRASESGWIWIGGALIARREPAKYGRMG